MNLPDKTIVIGLTGPLRAGCSTIANHFKEKCSFISKKLSDIIREELKNEGSSGLTSENLQTKAIVCAQNRVMIF